MSEAHATLSPSRLDNWFGPSRRLLFFLLFVVGLIAIFAGPLVRLMIYAAGTQLHSHIVLIPFVTAYLIYLRRNSLPKSYASSPALAIVSLAAGAASLVAAWCSNSFSWSLSENDFLGLMALSFICFLAAGVFLLLGRNWMGAIAFPFAFLIFLVPLPDCAADFLETASKLASTEVANVFFNISGMPVLREGTVFQLPGITIRVAQECSGIHSSWVLFITSLLAANLFLKSSWRRAVLVAAVIPLGILRNGFRILVIGLLTVEIGPKMIHSVIHRRGGPLFFVLSLIPLFLLLWLLQRQEIGTRRAEKEIESAAKRGSGG